MQSVDEVTIQNCPLLEVSLCFSHPLEKLHIENVPAIQELYVAHPVPRHGPKRRASIEGMLPIG